MEANVFIFSTINPKKRKGRELMNIIVQITEVNIFYLHNF